MGQFWAFLGLCGMVFMILGVGLFVVEVAIQELEEASGLPPKRRWFNEKDYVENQLNKQH